MSQIQNSRNQTKLHMSMEQDARSKDHTAPALPKYDRIFWTRRVTSQGSLSISVVLGGLGLRQSIDRSSKRGIPRFDNQNVKQLADAVTKISGELPTDTKALVDTATDNIELDQEVSILLTKFGEKLWGEGDRPWLFKASDGVENYSKDLIYENLADRAVLRHYLRTWILLKAFNVLRNKAAQARKTANSANADIPLPARNDDSDDSPSMEEASPAKRKRKVPGSTLSFDSRATSGSSTPLLATDLLTVNTAYGVDVVDRVTSKDTSPVTDNDSTASRARLARDEASSMFKLYDKSEVAKRELTVGLQRSERRPSMEVGESLELTIRRASATGSSLQGLTSPLLSSAKATTKRNKRGSLPIASSSALSYSDTDGSTGMGSRPTRRSRKSVATYNLAILSGTGLHTPTKYLDKHHKNVLHTSLDDTSKSELSRTSNSPRSDSRNSNPAPSKARFPLDEYWDETAWRCFTTAASVPMGIVTSSLGLKPLYREKDVAFVSPMANGLNEEINRIATRLYVQLSTEELVQCAADHNYLDQEIDILLDEFAPDLWSSDTDRSHLLLPGTGKAYEKDLVYEEDDSRKLLWIHLHRWVFAKAFSRLREQGTSDEAKNGTLEAISSSTSTGAKFFVPDRQYGLIQPVPSPMVDEGADLESDTLLRHLSGKRKRGKKRKSPAEEPQQYAVSTAKKTKTQRSRSKGTDALQPVNSEPTSPDTYDSPTADTPNGSHLTGLFLAYLTHHGQEEFAEATALADIEHAFEIVAPHLSTLLGKQQYSTIFPTVFAAWIDYRRTILVIKDQASAPPKEILSKVTLKIKHSRHLTELRKARDEFIARGRESLSAESVLCLGFRGLQQSAAKGDRVIEQIRNGLERLDERLVEFGETLGGGRWIIMG